MSGRVGEMGTTGQTWVSALSGKVPWKNLLQAQENKI